MALTGLPSNMAYPNTKTIRYIDENDGKEYDGEFLEQSRTEITAATALTEKLIDEGIPESTASAVTNILKSEGII
jgi:hypothetical protein